MIVRIAFTFILAVFVVEPALAETYQLDGVDISPAVELYRSRINTLNRSVQVYNWSPIDSREFPAEISDEQSLALFQKSGASFWQNYASPMGVKNVIGAGLYAAIDPLASRSYGGSEWALLRIHLPAGIKVIDISNSEGLPKNANFAKAKAVLAKFQCSNLDPRWFFEYGGLGSSVSCQRLARKLFQEILPIDAIVYSWRAREFQVCNPDENPIRSAMVVTRTAWAKPGDAVYFTQNTLGHLEERTLIESISMQEGNELDQRGSPIDTFSETEARQMGRSLIWPSLQGKKKIPKENVSAWLFQNRFGCDGKLPYIESPKL